MKDSRRNGVIREIEIERGERTVPPRPLREILLKEWPSVMVSDESERESERERVSFFFFSTNS